jgi:hypothetical protein
LLTIDSIHSRVHSFRSHSRTRNRPVSKLATSPLRPPRVSNLTLTLNRTSNIHNYRPSPMRGRASPVRLIRSEAPSCKPDVSVSTQASNISRRPVDDDYGNVIKTPTTVNEEPMNPAIFEESLEQYFNLDNRVSRFTPVAATGDRAGHRYMSTMQGRELRPFRSETPEIPTKRVEKTENEEQLPRVEKRTKRSHLKTRSPSPYEGRAKTKLMPSWAKMKQAYFAKLK